VVIDNQVDPTTGTVKIRGEFPNANLQLWPGQFVNMRLLIDTLRNAIVVPTAAIQRGPNGTFVYVVKEDNTVTARQVFLAQQDDVQSVVSRGVQSGERVVTTGFARLTEGTSIIVSGEAPGSAPPKRAPATETPRVEGSAAPSRPSRRQ
jgi:membrane fusion protein, multidrug efflux system